MTALSGNPALKFNDAQLTLTDQQRADRDELRSLERLAEAELESASTTADEELFTLTDRFVNIDAIEDSETENSANKITYGAPKGQNTKGPTDTQAPMQTQSQAQKTQKGTLSAEAILAGSALSPTGTQVISTLRVDANTIELLRGLQSFTIGEARARLALFAPSVQESFGRRDLWSNAPAFAGYHAMLDPMMLGTFVPFAQDLMDLRDDQIESCFHPFSEVDGYPTINGTPVWERQEWERIEYYNLFKLFRDMRYAFYNEADALVVNRSQAVLARVTQVPVRVINYLATVYNWQLRTSLYDAWMDAMQSRRVAVKRTMMVDRHMKISQALINKAFTYLNKSADKLAPKDAIEMLKLGLAYERISMGLPSDKPDTASIAAAPAAPLISVVNQTNNASGPLQVNNTPTQQLQDDMKRPDTLMSILAVLQRSGAFSVAARAADDSLPGAIEEDE